MGVPLTHNPILETDTKIGTKFCVQMLYFCVRKRNMIMSIEFRGKAKI
jgi:hypothetical protein